VSEVALGESGNAVNLFLIFVGHIWENVADVVNGRVVKLQRIITENLYLRDSRGRLRLV
jgi:hypothetical protein